MPSCRWSRLSSNVSRQKFGPCLTHRARGKSAPNEDTSVTVVGGAVVRRGAEHDKAAIVALELLQFTRFGKSELSNPPLSSHSLRVHRVIEPAAVFMFASKSPRSCTARCHRLGFGQLKVGVATNFALPSSALRENQNTRPESVFIRPRRPHGQIFHHPSAG